MIFLLGPGTSRDADMPGVEDIVDFAKSRAVVHFPGVPPAGSTLGGSMPATSIGSSKNPRSVMSIDVDALFGRYTYRIPNVLNEHVTNLSRLLILYGDNGCGKTTLLSMLFHTLSPATNRGHRTRLAGFLFNRFAVTLASGSVIEACRPPGEVAGGYTMCIKTPDGRSLQHRFDVDQSGAALDLDEQKKEEADRFIETLAEISPMPFLLSDKRTLVSDVLPSPTQQPRALVRGREAVAARDIALLQRSLLEHQMAGQPSERYDIPLEASIVSAQQWLQGQTLTDSDRAESDIHHLYVSLIRDLSMAWASPQPPEPFPQLLTRLQQLAARAKAFSEVGLMPELDVAPLVEMLRDPSQDETRRIAISYIGSLYANSMEARLSALDRLHRATTRFVTLLNGFFRDKRVSMHVRKGLGVVASSGEPLEPAWLSSGEKQLLLLMCTMLLSRTRETLFLIDEPELSLNVKWKRRLVAALLEMTEDAPVQFAMATHSIELLTPHRSNVVRLGEPEVPGADS